MHQIKIEPDEELFNKIYNLAKERDWSLKKTTERVMENHFGIRKLEVNNGYIHQNTNKAK